VRTNRKILAPNSLELKAHQGKGFLRLMIDYDQKITYQNPSKGLFLHAFGGWLPYFKEADANVSFLFNGISSVGFFSKDYLFDEILFARNSRDGFFSQQTFQKDAQVKTLSNFAVSENWMVGLGLSTSTPLPIPIRPYVDVAFYPDSFEDNVVVSLSAGLSIIFFKGVAEIYLPIFESDNIKNSLTYKSSRDTFLKRISFLFNLKPLHPYDVLDNSSEIF
jgi:hypothetical protein